MRLEISPEQASDLEDLLLEAGACAVTFQDNADQPIFEPDLGTTPLWNQTGLNALWEADTDMEAVTAFLDAEHQARLGTPFPANKVEILEDKDWVREWMDNFHPMQFGERLWICPSWREPPDTQAINLLLDPGLAFGTGTHPTTAMCLRWLDATPVEGQTVIDYGSGSGVLGIAALLLGAKSAMGVDTDPQALQASRENAERNGISTDRWPLYFPEDAPTEPADIMIANILAQPLIQLAPRLASLTRAGGKLVLSGILDQQANEVLERYSEWFEMDEPCTQDEWVRLTGIKRID